MDNTRPHRKILRSPSVKRKSKVLPVNQRVQLQRVLGVTVSSNAGLSCDSNNGTVAYPAGCVVVLFNPRRNKQSHIFNTSKKTITALAFSRDGKHLITGETGHQPAVRVWDVQEKTQVAEFRGHKFGINCVAFSPNMKEVVSVGTQHDMMINVWNWKTGNKVASNKVSSKVSALAFSEDGKCFVTVGNRHVRFWYLEDRRSKINQTVPLMGRSGILGDQKDNFFCDVVAGQGTMCGRFFVITQSGLLCEFNEKRQLDKWVELRTKSANCITAGQEHIFVGCAEGVVRVFSATSLHYLCSLPKPHHLGVEVTTATNPSHMVSNREDAKYPDTKAIAVDDDHKKVTCIYNDRSVYMWDVHDIKRVGKAWSFLYHSGCIWALEVYPQLEDGTKSMLPPGSFLTASGDDTIRVWNLNTHMPENTTYKRNIYSNELLKIVYVDPSLTSLCNVDYNPAGATDKTDTTYDGKNGVRSIRVSPDGADLASGDRQGNIRIYDTCYLSEKRCVEAHDSDVMCLEYSYTSYGHFLATSSRDRLIHVFDVDQNYGLVQTLGDHSSSITAVRFTDTEDKLRMISCGADKSILLRNAVTSPEFQFQLEHHLATKITLYDMVVDPTQNFMATACQDRNVRLYNIHTTKEKKCYKGSAGDEGILLRIHLDPSGTYAATTCTDKNVCILDFHTGELVATMYGHSEVITGVKFANDLRHVITVSADGCIFVWRLPSEMTNQIKGRLAEIGKTMKDTDYFRSDQPLMPNPVMLDGSSMDGSFPVVKSASTSHIPALDDESVEDDDDDEDEDDGASHASLDYRFSIGQLPNWAKAKFGDGHSEGSDNSLEQVQPKGRWAQRVDHNIEFKSQLDLTSEEDTSTDRRRTAEASASQLSELRRETVVLGKQLGNKNLPHIGGDLRGSTGDLRSSLPASPKRHKAVDSTRKTDSFGQYKSDTSLNLVGGKRWSDRYDLLKGNSLELDDTDELDTGSDTTEIIYPPTDSDSDLFANSYKVFAADDVKKQSQARSSHGNVSAHDDGDTSVSTDPISLEDDDDPNDETLAISNPTTPSSDPDKEFFARTPDKEDFVRENFEEDAFTPVPLEKFTKSLDRLEGQAADGAKSHLTESTPFSPRLSLSARFMSRAQPSLKNFSSSHVTYRPDNWYSRNKLEMTRAMDETRKSLLAMNLRRDSTESNSPEKEDPPSPPTKLEEESGKLPDNPSYSNSPPTGNTSENGLKGTVKDRLSGSRSQTHSQSPARVTPPAISSSFSRKVTQERERRKSGGKAPEQTGAKTPESPDKPPIGSSGPKYVTRTRPTYFKTTQSSRGKVTKNDDVSAEASSTSEKVEDASKKRARNRMRLSASKLSMYASTPNLISGLEDDEEEKKEKPQKQTIKFTSTTNLRLLSDLSRSVPDVNDVDSSTDSSSGGSAPRSHPRRSAPGQSKLTARFTAVIDDKQLMPPPPPGHPASVSNSLTLTQGSSSVAAPQRPHRKSSNSDLTLDQAKSILMGKSGVLGGSSKPTDPNTVPVSSGSAIRPGSEPRESTSSGLSSVSTLTGNSPPVFDNELAHSSPTQLAVAEEIEHTANMLRHQKQANMSGTFSPERLHSQPPSNLEASPLDLPERDQPRRYSSPKTAPQISSSSPSQPSGFSPSQSFHANLQSRTSPANNTYLVTGEENQKDSVFEETGDDTDNPKSVRDRIARFQPNPSRRDASGRSSSPYRRILPASPNTASGHPENRESPRSQSDTGLGSESSDTDTSMRINTATYTIGTKQTTGVGSVNGTGLPKGDRSKLALQLTPSPSSAPVSMSQCQSVLSDFRSQLQLVKEIFAQVDGKTDETALQVLALLGEVTHEAQTLITDIAAKTPSPMKSSSSSTINSLSSSSLSSSSSSVPQGSKSKTFHTAASKHNVESDTDITVVGSNTSVAEKNIMAGSSSTEKLALLSATKDMLQPLLSQLSQDLSEGMLPHLASRLSQDLSEGILKVVREKLNESS